MSPEINRSQTSVGASISISPIKHISGDVAGLLANFLVDLLGMFYSRRICSKANVVVTELVTNVMEHATNRDSEIKLDLRIDQDELSVRVQNHVTTEEYEIVKSRFDEIAAAQDPRVLLAKTVHARRGDRKRGGLGLMRLTAESKFQLSTEYVDGLLTVQASFSMKGFV